MLTRFKTAQEYRSAAQETLFQRMTVPVLATLILMIFNGVCASHYSFRQEEVTYIISIGGIVLFLANGPVMRGYYGIYLKLIRNQIVNVENLFDGFKDYARSFVLNLLIAIFVTLWTLLFIIPGIVMAYAYSMSYYILIDNPAMSASEARKASINMMNGHKSRLFCLHMSYIGWHLLAVLTLGILELWIIPRIQTATALFYQELVDSSNPPKNEIPKHETHQNIHTYDGNYPFGKPTENTKDENETDIEQKEINPFDDFSERK